MGEEYCSDKHKIVETMSIEIHYLRYKCEQWKNYSGSGANLYENEA